MMNWSLLPATHYSVLLVESLISCRQIKSKFVDLNTPSFDIIPMNFCDRKFIRLLYFFWPFICKCIKSNGLTRPNNGQMTHVVRKSPSSGLTQQVRLMEPVEGGR